MVLDARVGIISRDDISAMRVAAKLLMKIGYCTVGIMTSQKTDVCASSAESNASMLSINIEKRLGDQLFLAYAVFITMQN